jgi:predicted DNA-binding transcriptional regulator AlpA
VAGDDLWTTADIAQRLRISAEHARQLTRREDFPAPVQHVRHFSLWRVSDVEAWLERGRQDR